MADEGSIYPMMIALEGVDVLRAGTVNATWSARTLARHLGCPAICIVFCIVSPVMAFGPLYERMCRASRCEDGGWVDDDVGMMCAQHGCWLCLFTEPITRAKDKFTTEDGNTRNRAVPYIRESFLISHCDTSIHISAPCSTHRRRSPRQRANMNSNQDTEMSADWLNDWDQSGESSRPQKRKRRRLAEHGKDADSQH